MTVLKTSLRNFLAHKGRMVLSAIAVMLSVAFVCGTLVFTDTTNSTFDKLFAATASDVTVSPKDAPDMDEQQQTKTTPTIPSSQIPKLERLDGVKSAEGDVTSQSVTLADRENKSIGSDQGAPTIVTDWDRNELKSVKVTSGHAPRGAGELLIDADTAKRKKVRIGDPIRVISNAGDFKAKVVGLATFQVTNPGATIGYMDRETVQRKVLGVRDGYTTIGLTAASGVTHDQLKKEVLATGADFKAQTKKENTDSNREQLGSFLDIMKYAMLGFAGVAVLVGIFLIVNTFSMLVAQRTREIGLMRAIGSSRRQVNRSVLLEAVVLGVVGSALGVLGGIGVAVALMKLMGEAGMNLDTSQLTVKASTPIVGMVLGVVVTVVAAYLPARRAGKISPMAALRDAGNPGDSRAGRVRAVIGLVLTALGGGALVLTARADDSSQGGGLLGLGIMLTLVGFIVIAPLLAGFVVRALSFVILRVFGPVGRLAERNALRNPRRTGATGSALMIGLALVAGLSVFGSSLVASASDELDKSVGADFVIQGARGQMISEKVEKQLRAADGLDHLSDFRELRGTRLTAPGGEPETINLVASQRTYAEDLSVPVKEGRFADAFEPNSLSVSEAYAKKHKVGKGDRIQVRFKGSDRTAKLTVAAVTSAESSISVGTMYVSVDTARTYLGQDKLPMNMALYGTAKDGQEDQTYKSLKAELASVPTVELRNQADYKKLMEDQVGQLLNLVYGLLGLAIIVAILGVVNTLALSVVERTREIGLMRAIGVSRRQLRRMIRLESVAIALFGALLGLGLGLVWGVTGQRVLALEGLKVLEIPWSTIAVVFLGSAVVGLVAALAPAFRASRMNVLNAIATE